MNTEDEILKLSDLNWVLRVLFALTPMLWVSYYFGHRKTVLVLASTATVALLVLCIVAVKVDLWRVVYAENIFVSVVCLAISTIYFLRQRRVKEAKPSGVERK